jgi:hypothetical protein
VGFQLAAATLFINRHLNRGPSDFNVGRVGVVNGLWELPKLTHMPRLLQVLANGWEIAGILTVGDGLPFTPLISGDGLLHFPRSRQPVGKRGPQLADRPGTR